MGSVHFPGNIPQNFKAQWTDHNTELKEKAFRSVLHRIAYIVKEIIIFVPKYIASSLARAVIYPISVYPSHIKNNANKSFKEFWERTDILTNPYNSWFSEDPEVTREIRNTYKPHAITLETPDSKVLHGHYIRHKDADDENAKVILAFGGNGEPYQFGSVTGFLQESLYDNDTPYSFLMVDSRGVFDSTGKPTRDGLILDADTLYQYAETLGYDKDDIIIYGHSLGGAIGTHLKALHTDSNAPLILSRTFSSLERRSEDFADLLPFKPKKFLKWIAKNLGWTFDNVEKLRSINAPVHIMNHPDDQAILERAGLSFAMQQEEDLKENIHIHELQGGLDNVHNECLSTLSIDGQNASSYLRDHVFSDVTLIATTA